MKTLRHCWLALVVTAFAPLAEAADGVAQGLPEVATAVRSRFNVPGLAIAVMKDGRGVFEQGFGVRDQRGRKAVDASTLFCIASNTKSFTAVAIELLAAEGKLRLDDPVRDHLPWFQMSEPYATKELRIRDLLAHRSGLGAHAGDLLLLPPTTYTTKEVVERLRELPLRTGFRDSFAYENVMFAVATLVIEQASGQSYADFISQRVFTPLGMQASRIDATALRKEDPVATGHQPRADGSLLPVAPLAWKNNAGAAGIYSSAHDMALWMRALLDDKALLPADGRRRMWSMVTPIDIDPPSVPALAAAQPTALGYGEGWYLSDYRGHRLVWHTGGFPGAVSRVTLVPGLGLGVTVLTNQESEEAVDAVTLHVLDTYMDAPRTDWVEAHAAVAAKRSKKFADDDARRAREERERPPSLPLTAYAGRYRDRWYGDVDVSLERKALRMTLTRSVRLSGTLRPLGGHRFLARWDDRELNADAIVEFVPRDGAIQKLTMKRASARTFPAYDFQDLDLLRVPRE